MAEYKVATDRLRSQASELEALRGSLNDVALKLSGMQLGSIIQIKASTMLIGKVTDCKWAVIRQSGDLGQLSRGLDTIADTYDNVEKNLKEPKTEEEAKKEAGKEELAGIFSDAEFTISPRVPSPFVPFAGVISGVFEGYEASDENHKATAWIKKASAEAQNDWGYAGVNAYVGKVEAEAKAEAGFMKSTTKAEYKDGKWVEKTVTNFVTAEIGAGASAAVLAADIEAGSGDDMLGVEGKAEGAVGVAEAELKGKFSVSENGVNATIEGKAIVAAVEGKAEGTINIFGIEITGKASGYAGAAGVEGKIGFEDGKFVAEGGVAALIGGSAGIEIGFNDTGWDNFVDTVNTGLDNFVDFFSSWN